MYGVIAYVAVGTDKDGLQAAMQAGCPASVRTDADVREGKVQVPLLAAGVDRSMGVGSSETRGAQEEKTAH